MHSKLKQGDIILTIIPRYGDLCLYNSDKDTFDNEMGIVTYENCVQACCTLNVVTPRTTRQMRVAGTEAAFDEDII